MAIPQRKPPRLSARWFELEAVSCRNACRVQGRDYSWLGSLVNDLIEL